MFYLNFGLRLVICGGIMIFLIILFISLFVQKNKYYNLKILTSIKANIGMNPKGEMLPLIKPKSFLKMINAGENLCTDDIKFEYLDYCGSSERMFYYNGGESK